MEKKQEPAQTFDLFDFKEAKKKRARQAMIMQTWSMLSSIDYDEYDYDAWLMDLDAEYMELEKEIIADAVDNVLVVQERFNEACDERMKLRRLK